MSEAFNKFAQWAFFAGGGVIAENLRDEQPKIIKYNHLVTNLLIYHNVVNMSRALARLAKNGHQVIPDGSVAKNSGDHEVEKSRQRCDNCTLKH
jgi:TnpA family transposase